MCLTYDSIFLGSFAETKVVIVELLEEAVEYETVHFIGHAQYDAALTREKFLEFASSIETEIKSRIGVTVDLLDIKLKHFAPTLTDVDFIIKVPVDVDITQVIAVIGSVLGFVVWSFWTTWRQEARIYLCDQDSPPQPFSNWELYVNHLEVKHPAKYALIDRANATNWWEGMAPSYIPWIIVGASIVGAIGGCAAAGAGK